MLTGYEIVKGNDAGSFTGGGNKLVLHTTEGTSANGAISAYRANNSWPHFTLSFEENKRKIQHVETTLAARALQNNTADGYQTNRADCIQVEIVGYAKDAAGWSTTKLDWLAERFKEIRAAYSFPLQALEFKQNATRLSDKAFVDYAGIVGHQHCPDNTHWDPGALNIQYILQKMGATVPTGDKGVIVVNFKKYDASVSTDKDGNGYVDVYHDLGKDPTIVLSEVNGGIDKGGYPQIGDPTLMTASYEGKRVRVTVVGAKPGVGFGVKVLLGY